MGKTTVITHIQTKKKRRRVTKSLIYIFYIIKIKLQSNVHVSNQRINVHVQHVLKEKKPTKKGFFNLHILERFTTFNPQNGIIIITCKSRSG